MMACYRRQVDGAMLAYRLTLSMEDWTMAKRGEQNNLIADLHDRKQVKQSFAEGRPAGLPRFWDSQKIRCKFMILP
jgi:hypothetical protein